MTMIVAFGLTREDLGVLRAKRGWLLGFGIALAAVGVLALANSVVTTVASVLFVGAMMLLGGIVQVVYAFQVRQWRHFLVWLLIGALYVAAGVTAFGNPVLTSSVLTLLLAFSLIAAGILRVVAGIALRPMQGWGWLIAAGALTVLVGAIVLAGWPVNSLWLIGALLAIDLVIHGAALIGLALALRRVTPDAGTEPPGGEAQ
jgi:uncharacterized membrane protein HdeD (DUF308 family)